MLVNTSRPAPPSLAGVPGEIRAKFFTILLSVEYLMDEPTDPGEDLPQWDGRLGTTYRFPPLLECAGIFITRREESTKRINLRNLLQGIEGYLIE